MIKYCKFLLAISAINYLFTGCNHTKNIDNYKIDEYIKQQHLVNNLRNSNTTSSFNICKLTNVIWDSILVVKPYMPESIVKHIPIKNYSDISDKIYGQSLDESTCTLFFVRNNRYIGFSSINRGLVDFIYIEDNKNKPTWIYRSDCDRLVLTLDNYKRPIVVLE